MSPPGDGLLGSRTNGVLRLAETIVSVFTVRRYRLRLAETIVSVFTVRRYREFPDTPLDYSDSRLGVV